jgi:hypothetical protein
MRWRGFLLAVLMAAAWTCSGSPSTASSTAPEGTWGGAHLALTVGAAASHLEFDCAHGDIPSPFALDSASAFDLRGTFVREHGGPVRPGEQPDSHPAAFTGTVSGTRMTMTVRTSDTNETIGAFSLVHGSPGDIVKCL